MLIKIIIESLTVSENLGSSKSSNAGKKGLDILKYGTGSIRTEQWFTLRAPIKHFPFNTWDDFYFILYLLYVIVMTTMRFSTATEEIFPVSFMPKY